jgi:hypothetical protein
LPVSGNDKTWWWNLDAGFPGAVKQAVMAPGEIYRGEMPTPYTRTPGYQYGTGLNLAGTTNPDDALAAAQTTASLASPMPTATRALGPRPGFLPPPTPFTAAQEAAAAALPRIPSGALPYYSLANQHVPSARDLATASDQEYGAIRATGNFVPGGVLTNWATNAQQSLLTNHSAHPVTAPDTFSLLEQASRPHPDNPFLSGVAPGPGGTLNFNGADALRQGLSDIAGRRNDNGGATADARAASIALRNLDPLIDTIDPLAPTARGNWAASQRSQTLTSGFGSATTGIGERADLQAASSHSGMNFDNALRQRVKSFLQNSDNTRGFSDSEIASLNEIAHGSTTQNALRLASNFMGGGGGVAGLLSSVIGEHFLGPAGAIFGPGIGTTIKGWENTIAQRALDRVDAATRQRSPLYEANPRGQYDPTTGWARQRLQLPLGLLAPSAPGVQDAPPQPPPPPYLIPPAPSWGFPGVTSLLGRGSQ